jgi:hypothetical protein
MNREEFINNPYKRQKYVHLGIRLRSVKLFTRQFNEKVGDFWPVDKKKGLLRRP